MGILEKTARAKLWTQKYTGKLLINILLEIGQKFGDYKSTMKLSHLSTVANSQRGGCMHPQKGRNNGAQPHPVSQNLATIARTSSQRCQAEW